MYSALATSSSPLVNCRKLSFATKTNHPFVSLKSRHTSPPLITKTLKIKASANDTSIIKNLKTAAKAIILTAVTATMIEKLSCLPAKSEPSLTEQSRFLHESSNEEPRSGSPPLAEFLDSNSEAADALKSLLKEKLHNGEDEEALKILGRLVSAQPSVTDWKFLKARVLNEIGQIREARDVFDEILKENPFSFEALYENSILMDRCGEREAVVERLEEALRLAETGGKVKEARDVRLIMAQIQFLQKNVDEALRSYAELEREDPTDIRPTFCKGVIYGLMDRNAEAKEQFAKLSSRELEVEGFLRTPLSRMKLFGTGETIESLNPRSPL